MQNHQGLETRALKLNQLKFIDIPMCPKHQQMLKKYFLLYRKTHSYGELVQGLSRTKVIEFDNGYFAYEDFYWLNVVAAQIPHLEFQAIIIPECSYQRTNRKIVMRQLKSSMYSLNPRLLPQFMKRNRDLGFIRSQYKMQEWADVFEVGVSSLYFKESPFTVNKVNR